MRVNRMYLRRKINGKWVFVPMIVWEFSNRATGNPCADYHGSNCDCRGFEWYAIGPANWRLDADGCIHEGEEN